MVLSHLKKRGVEVGEAAGDQAAVVGVLVSRLDTLMLLIA